MGGLVFSGAEISRASARQHVQRHRHLSAYAALVLRGGYVEAGDRGRFRAAAGDVVLHDAFEAHQDDFGASGADILNLPLPAVPSIAFGRVEDADAVAREAERDPRTAGELLLEMLAPHRAPIADWPDLLAAALRNNEIPDIGRWARSCGLAPSSVSRGFRRCYGLSPQRFRLELRAAHAAREAARGEEPLAWVAAGAGFADQAHMCRTVKRLYGVPPSRLRRAKCVQASGATIL